MIAANAANDADADANADDADAANANANADADDDDDDDAANANANADADDADDADDDRSLSSQLFQILTREHDMREGLKLVQVPGSYYGRAVTLVGWLKRTSGDEFELHGAVMVWRTGQWAPGGLDDLAAEGPDSKRYGHSKPAKMPEELHRLTLRRSKPANPEAWAKICPRPKNWEASE